MGLKFPGKFVRRNCGLEEGHLTITRKSIHSSATGKQALETCVFPGTYLPAGTRTVMQMFCPAVVPSAQLGVCSDGGEALLTQVGPCSVIAEALTGGGKVLAAAGIRGKPFVFIQPKL